MLSSSQRLTSREFSDIYKRGTSACGVFVCVRIYPNNLEFYRVACVVPLKISRKAVVRNRGRRRLYGTIEQTINQVALVSKNFDIIIIAKTSLENISFNNLSSDVKTTIEKALRKYKYSLAQS